MKLHPSYGVTCNNVVKHKLRLWLANPGEVVLPQASAATCTLLHQNLFNKSHVPTPAQETNMS
jgi:hypothetical protein